MIFCNLFAEMMPSFFALVYRAVLLIENNNIQNWFEFEKVVENQ